MDGGGGPVSNWAFGSLKWNTDFHPVSPTELKRKKVKNNDVIQRERKKQGNKPGS